MTEATPRGRFVWFDLVTTDPDATHDFYSAVTGWETKGAAAKARWMANGEAIGAVTSVSSKTRGTPYWLGYIATSSVDETLDQAVALGARVLNGPFDIASAGRFAIAADPQGATFAVCEPASTAAGHEGEARVGEFSWHELATHDYPAAYRFYERLFGWRKSALMHAPDGGEYQMFERNGVVLGGMFNKTPEMPGTPAWLHYVLVDDVHRAVEAVTSRGGRVVVAPAEVPGGDWVAQCVDPQGAMFAVHSRKK